MGRRLVSSSNLRFYVSNYRSTGKAMKLGAKSKDVDHFVDKLISEGQDVRSSALKSKKADVAKTVVPAALTERSALLCNVFT